MTHQHDEKSLLKALLPSVPVPEDFEETLWLRRTLQSLPTLAVPEDFEEALWRRLRAERRKVLLRRLGLLLGLTLGGGSAAVWYFLHQPSESPQAPLRPVVQIEPLTFPSSSPTLAPQSPRLPKALGKRPSAPPEPTAGGTTPLTPPDE